MEQRVNIQYSIDIGDLPAEVARLMQKSVDTLADISENEAKELSSFDEKNLLSIHSLEVVEETRRKLAAVDYILNDITNIVDGFIKYKTTPPATAPEEKLPEMPPEFRNPEMLSDETTLADLKSRIEDFKRTPTVP